MSITYAKPEAAHAMSENQTPQPRRESHLMPAEMTDPDLIRVVLSGLPVANAIVTPPGVLAITRRDVMKAGLDTLAVTRWLQPLGGFGAVAYLRPTSHRDPTAPIRPALHPISYFAVPAHALATPAGVEAERDASSTAVA
jgi:hypothetical protein